MEDSSLGRTGPQAGADIYHLDRERLGCRTIIILNEVRLSLDREHRIRESFSLQHIENPVIFVYLAAVMDTSKPTSLASILGFIVSPSLKEIEIVAQASTFVMNECFVQYILGRDDDEFCSFLRRQDDSFARLLLDYAIGGRYYDNDVYQANVKFLQWEVSTRESL